MAQFKVKQLAGATAAVIGTVGTIFCVFAAINVWSLAQQFRDAADGTLVQLEAIFGSVHRQSNDAIMLVATTRERLGSIQTSTEQLKEGSKPRHPAATSILDVLDEDIVQQLKPTEEFIRRMQANMRSASSAALHLDSLSFLSPRASRVDQPASQLQTLAASLIEISDLLDQVIQILVDLRSQSGIDATQWERLQRVLARVDNKLNELELEIRGFAKKIGTMEADLSDLQQAAPARINRAAVLATVFLICFGGSQISMLLRGCHLVRRN